MHHYLSNTPILPQHCPQDFLNSSRLLPFHLKTQHEATLVRSSHRQLNHHISVPYNTIHTHIQLGVDHLHPLSILDTRIPADVATASRYPKKIKTKVSAQSRTVAAHSRTLKRICSRIKLSDLRSAPSRPASTMSRVLRASTTKTDTP